MNIERPSFIKFSQISERMLLKLPLGWNMYSSINPLMYEFLFLDRFEKTIGSAPSWATLKSEKKKKKKGRNT